MSLRPGSPRDLPLRLPPPLPLPRPLANATRVRHSYNTVLQIIHFPRALFSSIKIKNYFPVNFVYCRRSCAEVIPQREPTQAGEAEATWVRWSRRVRRRTATTTKRILRRKRGSFRRGCVSCPTHLCTRKSQASPFYCCSKCSGICMNGNNKLPKEWIGIN